MWDLEHLGSISLNAIVHLMPAIILISLLVTVKQVTVMQSKTFRKNQFGVNQVRNKDFVSPCGILSR